MTLGEQLARVENRPSTPFRLQQAGGLQQGGYASRLTVAKKSVSRVDRHLYINIDSCRMISYERSVVGGCYAFQQTECGCG